MVYSQPAPVAHDVIAPGITYRDLVALGDFGAVVALERAIWGPDYDEAVPPAILKVTRTRGGILIGAFDEGRLIGFVYSLLAYKDGKLTQWSHKLGIAPRYRNAGVGYRLKLLQRQRALEMGVDVIEWTFDPMQAANARLNVAKLGTIVEEYEADFYGGSTVPLRHRDHPTDRFIAVWNIRDAHVEQRLVTRPEAVDAAACGASGGAHVADEVPAANRAVARGEWIECAAIELHLAAPRLVVRIPTGFADMLSQAPDCALTWRLATRRIFTHYFERGYRVVDFAIDPPKRTGAYVLVRQP